MYAAGRGSGYALADMKNCLVLSARDVVEARLSQPRQHDAMRGEPRKRCSRGSLLTGRLRSSVAVHFTRQVGLEPTTSRLTAGCSTIELLPNCAGGNSSSHKG